MQKFPFSKGAFKEKHGRVSPREGFRRLPPGLFKSTQKTRCEWLLRSLQRSAQTDTLCRGSLAHLAEAGSPRWRDWSPGALGPPTPHSLRTAPGQGCRGSLPSPGLLSARRLGGRSGSHSHSAQIVPGKSGPSCLGAVLRYLSLIPSIEMLINRSETFLLCHSIIHRYIDIKYASGY